MDLLTIAIAKSIAQKLAETIPKGDKGPQGETGNGIASIEKTSTVGLVDTYTILFTNGNTTTFEVKNGAVSVDPTLSISGAAADAKVVGDDISEVKNTVSKIVPFSFDYIRVEMGGVSSSDGSDLSNQLRLRTGFFYALQGGIISVDDGYQFMVARYSNPNASAFISGVTFSANNYTIPTDGFYRIAFRKTSDTNFKNPFYMFEHLHYSGNIKINPLIKKYTYGAEEVCAFKTIGSDGLSQDSGTLGCTSYLPCFGAESLSYSRVDNNTASGTYGMAFYDENKTLISYVGILKSNISFYYTNISVPSNAHFVRFTSWVSTNEELTKDNFYVEFESKADLSKRPYQDGYFFFSQKINNAVNQYWNDNAEVELEYDGKWTTGVIALPKSYTPTGKPTPVIMYFHGYSHYVYMDTWGNTDNFRTQKQHWLDMGFAVMDCNGARDNNKQGGYTSGGSIQYVNGYRKCWEYIKNHYNVEDMIYVVGGSAGGIASINYCYWYNDVKALCLLSAWTDLYVCSWQQGITDTIKEYLGMGDTYDANKAIGFDPTSRILTIANSEYLPFVQIPTKVLIGSEESATGIYSTLYRFVNALRNAGQTVNIRDISGATHTEVVSGGVEFIDTEVGNWFKSV